MVNFSVVHKRRRRGISIVALSSPSVNKRSRLDFVEQYRREPLKDELSQWPGKMRRESHARLLQLYVMEPIGGK